ncbi:glycoside hydrolase family 5 protein [Xylophilus sp. GOD-11R]|uniref:glycoside hydrolase family 5 protein n=1 Tax=Xylophilus sp. GOD-11R TaxID=3089814 RepID=UPI00298BE88B|nr:cellulase family glycosylhydrolase [Xylophilus sp. GOD-11R]WPB56373.1 cellulase family glycosylhydrolase [Xylophilus sp. GOD-11R]
MDHQRRLLCMALAGAGILPAAHAQGASKRTPSGKGFEEPGTAQEYVATMRLGMQASDYLEMAYQPAARRNAVGAADFDVMRREGGIDHVRIPANCAARADAEGVISEAFLRTLDEQIDLVLERFERVVVDPLHHYLQWFGAHQYDKVYDDYQTIGQFNTQQHAARATAMWVQLAKRYQDRSLRLSFDLLNEPGHKKPPEGYPPGLSPQELNDWFAVVIPAIRATGGNNANRVVWLEPFDNQLQLLAIPTNAGPLGVSPHFYTPFPFTHRDGTLTAPGMANYTQDILYAQEWSKANGVPVWIGEVGVSKNNSATRQPRPDADRAEYIAHVRNTRETTGVPMCLWAFNSTFALYDSASQRWMPGIRQALTGLPQPYPVRPIPEFTALKGGRIARGYYSKSLWPGFRWDPATGILTSDANPGGNERQVSIVFPDIKVESGQSWIVRAAEFTGSWRIGAGAAFEDAERADMSGKRGVDVKAINDKGQPFYAWRPSAPGGFETAFGTLVSTGTFLSVDLTLSAGSPRGQIRFLAIQSG